MFSPEDVKEKKEFHKKTEFHKQMEIYYQVHGTLLFFVSKEKKKNSPQPKSRSNTSVHRRLKAEWAEKT